MINETSEPAHESLTVPTNDPGACEQEQRAKGWKLDNIFVGRFHPSMCEGRLYALRFWRPVPPPQMELL